VLSDDCDGNNDRFTLRVERIIRNSNGNDHLTPTMDVDQAAGDSSWKLQALI
jgi:hypothetical protein